MAHKNKSNWNPYSERIRRRPTGQKSSLPGRGVHKRPTQIYTQAQAEVRLADIFYNHGLAHIGKKEISQLAAFYRLLMECQQHSNFTRLLKFRDVAIKHFIDSLMLTELTSLQFPLLDLGTGPGLPGIPLKIHYPHAKIILAEGVQKRVEFLKEVREKLKLPSLEIIGRNINPEFVYPVQGVVTRAVEDMSNTLNNISQCLQTGGQVYFMKGPNVDPEIPAALNQWGEYFKLVEDRSYELAKTPHQRRLIIFKKIKPIPLLNINSAEDLDHD